MIKQEQNEYEIVVEAIKTGLFFPQRAQFSTIRKAPNAMRAEAEFYVEVEMEMEIRQRGLGHIPIHIVSIRKL